jgi:hypothetical protein
MTKQSHHSVYVDPLDSQTSHQELFRVMRKDLRQLVFYD